MNFWNNFGTLFFPLQICIDFLCVFSRFVADFLKLDPYETLRGRTNFEDRRFQRKSEKSSKTPPKILPKSSQNPSEFDQKSKKIASERDFEHGGAQKREKVAQEAPKRPTWPHPPVKPDLAGERKAHVKESL